jgi:hypothetical protein
MFGDLNDGGGPQGPSFFFGPLPWFNPGMGWPLAVSAALMERKPAPCRALMLAFDISAMIGILLPFSLMDRFGAMEAQIRMQVL